jgi:aminoglycoside phosphotransferase (APT) family kinase protein
MTQGRAPDEGALARWLEERLPGEGPVRLGPFEKPGSGLSGGTVLVDAIRRQGDTEALHQLVVRFPSTDGEGLFPEGDLNKELAFHDRLEGAGIPVAPVVGFEQGDRTLGKPFVVTKRVQGRVVASSDPYLKQGWLHDATEDHQRRLLYGFFDILADMHRIEVRAAERREVLDAFGTWTRYLEWADNGSAPESLYEASAWCAQNIPDHTASASPLWGDPQIANAVFSDDGTVAALLDFELCTTGPAELDLGWFLCLHDMTVARCGEDLPGFSDRAALLAHYEQRLGRDLHELDWYEIFGAVCTASILVRVSVVLGRGGADFSWLARTNPAVDYLQARLG